MAQERYIYNLVDTMFFNTDRKYHSTFKTELFSFWNVLFNDISNSISVKVIFWGSSLAGFTSEKTQIDNLSLKGLSRKMEKNE